MTTVEKAEKEDFRRLAEIDRRAWKDNRQGTYIPDGEHAWRIWIEHALVYRAVIDGRIAGGILAFPCASGIWFLHKVFTDAEHRCKGIASKLFDALLKEIDDKKLDLFLTVDPVNERAIRIYEKMGFTEREYAKSFYRENEDRLVLTRRAPPS